MDAGRLYRLGTRLHAYLDPDGAAPSDKDDAKPRRELHLHTGRDGRLALRGILDAETGSLLQEVLSPPAKPEGEDGKPDPRSAAERNGDALADILNLVADTGKLPIQGAERPHLTVTISWEMLRDCLGVARAYEGLTISPETARRLACDADIIPIILNSEGVPLDVGRKERLAGPELRKALIARDKGRTRPGCTRPVRHTRSHHIVSWVDGGTTCLENCVLLCDRHHRENSPHRLDRTDEQRPPGVHPTTRCGLRAKAAPKYLPPVRLTRTGGPPTNNTNACFLASAIGMLRRGPSVSHVFQPHTAGAKHCPPSRWCHTCHQILRTRQRTTSRRWPGRPSSKNPVSSAAAGRRRALVA
ncbi:HNH endonuclease signature motif containing protein [Fodinicola acaciae]|uniref:HNH endonuclease signature motif containing protein n=1 Tax=Fodinicola acaciae TaxID=2681555 RepID=UPI0013D4659B